MAEKSVITTLESRVKQLMDDHKRLSGVVRELTAEVTKLKSEKRMGLWHGSIESGYTKQEGTGMYDGEWLDEKGEKYN